MQRSAASVVVPQSTRLVELAPSIFPYDVGLAASQAGVMDLTFYSDQDDTFCSLLRHDRPAEHESIRAARFFALLIIC